MDNGTQIGPYRIDGLLGRGGMAEVYKAWHSGLHHYHALKVLSNTHDPLLVERFLDEARTVAQLQHHHIVPIHSVSEPDCATPYFTMDYIDGGDLADLLHERGRLSLAEALPILEQIADALDYGHRHPRHIIHRDVKPANVLLQAAPHGGWNVKMVDFGIASTQAEGNTRLTKTGMIVGTPAYMSPEQCGSGPKPDYHTDIYALGIIAYELLCGHPPFESHTDSNPLSVIMKQVHEAPRPLIEQVPGLPVAANNAILRALAKDPTQRFNTCTEFVQALRGGVVPPPPPPPPGKTVITRPPGARKKSPVIPVVAGFAVLMGVGLIAAGTNPKLMSLMPWYTPPVTPTPLPLPPPPQVKVPDLSDMKEAQARASLEPLHLQAQVTTGSSTKYFADHVMSQWPAKGTMANPNSPVVFRISTGPGPVTPTPATVVVVPTDHGPGTSSGGYPSSKPSSTIVAEVRQMLDGWKSAWERLDASSHMSYYTSDAKIFSNGSWANYDAYYGDRVERFNKDRGATISVTYDFSDDDIEMEGDKVHVTMRVHFDRVGGSSLPYHFSRSGQEEMTIRKQSGDWKIEHDEFHKD